MGLTITSAEYVDYLKQAGAVIQENGDYITMLDSKNGDGDHWVNLHTGFQKLLASEEDLKKLPLSDMLKKVGMTLMAAIGGSSGVLYGSGYIAAAKALKGVECLNEAGILTLLDSMLQAIMERGKTKPGFKTMVDSLYEGVKAYRKALDDGSDSKTALEALEKGAHEGMERTKEMEAVKGRASYQENKGVGDLDPGAVTMYLQLKCMSEFLLDKAAAL
jgi:dihydroxyacetone kinase-like protein